MNKKFIIPQFHIINILFKKKKRDVEQNRFWKVVSCLAVAAGEGLTYILRIFIPVYIAADTETQKSITFMRWSLRPPNIARNLDTLLM